MADEVTSLTSMLNYISAAAGLGTAAMGLVDATKVFGGGPSQFGFGHIKRAVTPFLAAGFPEATSAGGTKPVFGKAAALDTLRASWINGVAKPDQKAKAKALIHLGLTKNTGTALAALVKLANVEGDGSIDGAKLASLAAKMATGEEPTQDEINVLAQFDVVLSAVLDEAYERADQQYRNASKACAAIVSTVLGVIGGWLVYGNKENIFQFIRDQPHQFAIALLVGVSATPLAPVAKDLASSLQAAVAAIRAAKS